MNSQTKLPYRVAMIAMLLTICFAASLTLPQRAYADSGCTWIEQRASGKTTLFNYTCVVVTPGPWYAPWETTTSRIQKAKAIPHIVDTPLRGERINETDGCSIPTNLKLPDTDIGLSDSDRNTMRFRFEAACNEHDLCYGTVASDVTKARCDGDFWANMRFICSHFDPTCIPVADTMYLAVALSKEAQDAFDNGQKRGAKLVPTFKLQQFGRNAGGWHGDKHPRMTADVNGDGRADLVGFANSGVYVALATTSGFQAHTKWSNEFGYNAGNWRVDKHPRTVADVNGDGKADVIGFAESGVYVALSTGTSFEASQRWIRAYGYDAGNWRVEYHPRTVADVNGDGKADVVGFGASGVWVSLSTGSSFTHAPIWSTQFGSGAAAGGWRVDRHPRAVADVNRDGKADVIGFATDGVYVALSTGRGFATASKWSSQFTYSSGWRVDEHVRSLADVNNDGRADIVGFGTSTVYVAYATGSGFKSAESWAEAFTVTRGGWNVIDHPRTAADVTGDGKADLVGFAASGVYTLPR